MIKFKIFCKICNEQTKYTSDHFSRYHLKTKHNLDPKSYYDLYLKKDNEGKCIVCGCDTSYYNMIDGYAIYCSPKCKYKCGIYINNRNNGLRNVNFDLANEKRIKTCMEKYGVEYISQSKHWKNKFMKTCMEKYGEETTLNLPQVKKSRFERLFHPDVKEKRQKSILKSINIAKEKRIKTNMEKYGVEYVSQLPNFRNKISETLHIKYGFKRFCDLTEFEKYDNEVRLLSNKYRKQLKLDNNYCYYTGVKLIDKRNHPLSKVMDHKTSIIYGFNNNIPKEIIANKNNLCICCRKANSKKHHMNENIYLKSSKYKETLDEIKQYI